MGPTDLSDYTIQADVRGLDRRRQMGDIGIVAQRYEMVLFGNHQRLELQPWQPEVQRTVKVDYKWNPNAWYMIKLEVQSMGGGRVRARGKVWPKGETEPAAWTIERVDPIGSLKGSPGLYADAPSQAGGGSEFFTTTSRCSRTLENRESRVRGSRVRGFEETHRPIAAHVAGCAESPARAKRALAAMGVGPQWARGGGAPRATNKCRHKPMKKIAVLIGCTLLGSLTLIARSDPPNADWPMWGGTPDRNMVSSMKGLPTTWDVKTKKNIKWVAELGSQTYGNPVVAGGMVFVGTNNEGNKDPRSRATRAS